VFRQHVSLMWDKSFVTLSFLDSRLVVQIRNSVFLSHKLIFITINVGKPGSSVSTRTERAGFHSRQWQKRIFSLYHHDQTSFRSHSGSYPIGTGGGEALSPGVKQPGRETDQTPPSSAEVKMCDVIPPHPIRLHALCLVKDRDNFTLTLIFSEACKLRNWSLYSLVQAPTTSFLIGPHILLSTLFSNTFNLCSSLSVRDHQVSHPYR